MRDARDAQDIVDRTCSIVFLGTPHQGSQLSMPAAAAAFVSGFLGSDTTLLYALKNRSKTLSTLQRKFQGLMESREEKVKIFAFWEEYATRVFGLFSIGLVSAGRSLTLLIV
jgi:hypothetical protein